MYIINNNGEYFNADRLDAIFVAGGGLHLLINGEGQKTTKDFVVRAIINRKKYDLERYPTEDAAFTVIQNIFESMDKGERYHYIEPSDYFEGETVVENISLPWEEE